MRHIPSNSHYLLLYWNLFVSTFRHKTTSMMIFKSPHYSWLLQNIVTHKSEKHKETLQSLVMLWVHECESGQFFPQHFYLCFISIHNMLNNVLFIKNKMKKNSLQNEKCSKNNPTENGKMLTSKFYKILIFDASKPNLKLCM